MNSPRSDILVQVARSPFMGLQVVQAAGYRPVLGEDNHVPLLRRVWNEPQLQLRASANDRKKLIQNNILMVEKNYVQFVISY